MVLRIIGGELRGKKLTSIKGDLTRPTADRVREAIFNILAFHISRATVLDLFAGTGALGIEALSRGASSAVFIDNSRDALSVIEKNIHACRLESRSSVLKRDILKQSGNITDGRNFSLVLLDPPYHKNFIRPALSALEASDQLKENARIVIEHSILEKIPQDIRCLKLTDQRKYGKTSVSFMSYAVSPA
jgi:16S rRNA (guanine966-N2)-methyltransferase